MDALDSKIQAAEKKNEQNPGMSNRLNQQHKEENVYFSDEEEKKQ